MGQGRSKDAETMTTSTTTITPELYYHHHHHHHRNHTVLVSHPAFPESPTRPTRVPPTLMPRAQGAGQASSLGFPAILFISIGSGIVLLVFCVCVFLTFRHCKRRRLATWKQESKVGRAIQRSSFFPRFSRYRNQPIVLNYPDPDSHLPNYAIRTPYTFSSSSTLASSPGSIAFDHKNIPDVPSYRATIF